MFTTCIRVTAVLAVFTSLCLPGFAAEQGLEIEGTAFVLHASDGRVLRGTDLIGAELDLDGTGLVRIEGVRPDPQGSTGGVLLHTISVQLADGRWKNPCEAAADKTRDGIALAGSCHSVGRFHAGPERFALSCNSGAQANWVRFADKPWKVATDGMSLAPFYEACVHMVRADYCGDGVPATRNGTLIDIFDRHGVQASADDPSLHFEAGWSPTGAVCVAHTCIAQELDLRALVERCPRLRDRVGERCDPERAGTLGAIVFNGSR
ncbi:MAG: ADYC domain-containing protein [Dokdonella sp.]